jgi:hypothetical protein
MNGNGPGLFAMVWQHWRDELRDEKQLAPAMKLSSGSQEGQSLKLLNARTWQ